ncbi:OsmC family protein, partial [Bacteroidota bacterium]
APAPFDLFLASIATCSGIYVKSFCRSRNIDTSNITLIQRHSYNQEKRLIDQIEIEVHLPEDFPEKYKPMIQNVIDQCAVKKHLMNPPEFSIKV